MSTLQVKVEEIGRIEPHPNADRLDLATILGWQCVVQKGKHKPGDKIVYFPIDSILPMETETKIFGPESKVKLNKSRVKTIKLRGAISQGLAVAPEVLGLKKYKLGDDLTKKLGVTKHEPPPPRFQGGPNAQRSRKQPHPHFKKYTSIENFKNYNKLFAGNEEVVITEKIHGTNFRCGWVPFEADTLWKKLKGLLGLNPKFEFVFGSHNVQLQNKMLYKGWYDKNVYSEAVHKYKLKEVLSKGQVVYGEVYGAGIQKGYTYGCEENERKLIIFDLMEDGKYLDHDDVKAFGISTCVPVAPKLYDGPFGGADLEKLVSGPSVLAPSQKVREGVVIRPIHEEQSHMGRKILKAINPDYLLKDQTEYH